MYCNLFTRIAMPSYFFTIQLRYMKKNIHVIVAIIGVILQLLTNQTFAQSSNIGEELITITGKVVSTKDNQPLSNVSVKVLKSKTGTISGDDGVFTIKVKKELLYNFRGLTYFPKTFLFLIPK